MLYSVNRFGAFGTISQRMIYTQSESPPKSMRIRVAIRMSDGSSPKKSASPPQTPAMMPSRTRYSFFVLSVAMVLSVFTVNIEFSGGFFGDDDPEDDVGPDRKPAEDYQKQVYDKFAEIETLYNNYQQQKASLSATTRQVLEDTILSKEKDATALQESLFGKDGTLMKKRLELIQPIQKKVFDAINAYAQSHGYDLVLDSASNPTLLYNAPKLDQTEGVIKSLK